MRDGDSKLSLWGWWFYLLPIPYMIIISVQKSPLWLCIIPFVILLWWLVKPSDNEMRDDGLAIDKQPKVRFKKSDKIMLIVLLILFLLGGLTLSYYNNKKADVVELTDEQLETRTEQPELIEEQVEEEYSTKRENTPFNILSVDEALTILGFYPNYKIEDMLSKKYNYDENIQSNGGEYETAIWIKDCKYKIKDDGSYELISKSEKSSECYIEIGHRIDVYAYSKEVFNSWRSQIMALGYKLESEDESRYGLEWKWKKKGEPYIILSDDQSGMFLLTIERNE